MAREFEGSNPSQGARHNRTEGKGTEGNWELMNIEDLTNLRPVNEAPLPEPGERARLRKRYGVTQVQLAQALNVSRKTVSTWEQGKGEPIGEHRQQYSAILAAWQRAERGTA